MSFRTWIRGVFGRPTQFEPTKYGEVRVWFGVPGEDWSSQQLAQFEIQLGAMRALGPDFVRVMDPAYSDVRVRHWDSTAKGGPLGCGQYTRSLRLVEIDPVGCAGFLELRTALGHELCHFLGMRHIRHHASEPGEDFSPVGVGIAMMNQHVSYDGTVEITTDTYDGHVPACDPTALDLTEYRRVHAL
jgi:hypothetical protein